jgi:hypothetical protein
MPVLAQKIKREKVPSAVSASFNKLYPDINNAQWELEKGVYEANFRNGTDKKSATFDKAGNLIETETEIKAEVLPAAVQTYISKNLKGGKIKSASLIKQVNGITSYEANVGNTDYIFDGTGKFLSTQKD